MATGRRGKPFEPGNKLGKGRPPGSRNKRSELQELLQAHAPSLINKCLWAALNGDMTALRLCLERLVPVAKTPVMRFRLGKLETEEDWMNLLPRILKQACKGEGSAVEVEFYARVVESHFRCVAACDFDRRLGALEEQKKSEEEQKIPKGLVRIEAGSDEPVSNGTAAQETGTEEGGETETQARNQGDCLKKQIGVDAPRSRNEVGEKSSNSDGAQRPGLGSITVDLDKKKSEEEQRKPNGLECLGACPSNAPRRIWNSRG